MSRTNPRELLDFIVSLEQLIGIETKLFDPLNGPSINHGWIDR
jgi:hypothetical protein